MCISILVHVSICSGRTCSMKLLFWKPLFWCVVSPDLCVSILVCGQPWPVHICFGVWSALTCVYLFWCMVSHVPCVSVLVSVHICRLRHWKFVCIYFGVCLCLQGEAMTMCVSILVRVHMCIVRSWVTLQALVYDILPPITAISDYAKDLWKPSAKGQLFFVGTQLAQSF